MYAIRREIKLNNKERTFFEGCAGFSRFVYNYGLNLIKKSWEFEGIKGGDSKRLSAIKKILNNVTKVKPEFHWMKQYSSRIYQNAFRDLAKAFSNWRNRELRAEMPQFKKKRHDCSFTVDSSNGKILVSQGKLIKVPTLGTFRLKEAIPYACVSQTFTVTREAGKWFISFMVEACPLPEMKHTKQVVGIDLGVKTFATLSDGTTIEAPKTLKKAKTKLSKLQWRNRNKVLGNRREGVKPSSNAIGYYDKLRGKHKYIANVREDFLQKTTTQLGKTFQRIQIEDLNVKGMIANHKLAEAVSSVGLFRFRELLTEKQDFHGFELVVVDRWFPSSRTCHVCGNYQEMPLKERTYLCSGCGAVYERDWNASVNIERWPSLPEASGIRMPVDEKRAIPLD